MVRLLPKDEKAISCMSIEEHNFFNYGETQFFNYIVNLYVENGLEISKGIERACVEIEFVQSLLN